MVSAGHVGGTRSSGIVSSATNVLWMSVVCGELVEYMRCVCVWLGAVRLESGESGLGLGFTNTVGTGEWVGAWTRVWRVGWCYVCETCESGISV